MGIGGVEAEAEVRDASPTKAIDPLNDLLELSVQDILPSATKGEENLMDLGFDMPFVFDKSKGTGSGPADVNLTSQPAPVPTSNDPFDFDIAPKVTNPVPEPPKAPQPLNDDPFGFL